MKNLVVLTGAGMSRESGLKTFREMGGLWEEYDIMTVASPEGWDKRQNLVLRFYNERRKQLKDAKPNAGHKGLAYLEKDFNVQIITQNVDNLHERGGSSNVFHLHGELTKVRSTVDASLITDIGYKEIKTGDLCKKGSQLRPHIVWFGEAVPAMDEAVEIAAKADIFVIIGTSLIVYPAASIIDYVPLEVPVFLIDPNELDIPVRKNLEVIKAKASDGIAQLIKRITEK